MQAKDGSYTLYIIYSNKQNQNDMKKKLFSMSRTLITTT